MSSWITCQQQKGTNSWVLLNQSLLVSFWVVHLARGIATLSHKELDTYSNMRSTNREIRFFIHREAVSHVFSWFPIRNRATPVDLRNEPNFMCSTVNDELHWASPLNSSERRDLINAISMSLTDRLPLSGGAAMLWNSWEKCEAQ